MGKHCVIMKRMKENYENRAQNFLYKKIPVIIRIDGKAFHTYTKGLDKPFDIGLIEDMNETAIYLCKNIQGAKCAYVQSDEISILVTDYDKHETDAWFDYNIQKVTSIAASLATSKFNQLIIKRHFKNWCNIYNTESINILNLEATMEFGIKLANFDARCFNIPKEEIANYFLARQKDAVRNSISSVAQSLYNHKELDGKNSNELQEMIFQRGINWNDFHFGEKRGRWIVKNTYINGILMYNTINLHHPLRSNPNIINGKVGDLLYNPDDNKVLIIKPIWDEDLELTETEVVKNPTIRTKWELVETPEKFTDLTFKQLGVL